MVYLLLAGNFLLWGRKGRIAYKQLLQFQLVSDQVESHPQLEAALALFQPQPQFQLVELAVLEVFALAQEHPLQVFQPQPQPQHRLLLQHIKGFLISL